MADFSTVVVLDHRPLVAELLAAGLTARGYRAIGHQLTSDTPVRELSDADVLLLDASSGWAATQRWLAASGINGHGPRVVLMTEGAPPVGEVTARRAGVWGWFASRSTLGTASTVVRTVLNGRPCFPAQARTVKIPEQRHALTTREQQVLAEIAAGVSYAEIAERLQVTHNTVRTHATSIRTKLGVRSRSAAVAVANGVRIADTPDRCGPR
jgi:DNA-binding NarL/FixJ family response regulator